MLCVPGLWLRQANSPILCPPAPFLCREGASTEDRQTDPRGLSWVTYWSGIEKARRKRMFSQQMVLGSSME